MFHDSPAENGERNMLKFLLAMVFAGVLIFGCPLSQAKVVDESVNSGASVSDRENDPRLNKTRLNAVVTLSTTGGTMFGEVKDKFGETVFSFERVEKFEKPLYKNCQPKCKIDAIIDENDMLEKIISVKPVK